MTFCVVCSGVWGKHHLSKPSAPAQLHAHAGTRKPTMGPVQIKFNLPLLLLPCPCIYRASVSREVSDGKLV